MTTKKVAAALMAAIATQAGAASFDCTKAATRVERMICADISLSRLDDELAMAYSATAVTQRSDASAVAWLKKKQREWLRQRNACETPACLREAYITRIDELCSMPALVGAHPNCSSEGL